MTKKHLRKLPQKPTVREDPIYVVKGRLLTEEDIESFDASGGFDSVAQELADLYDQEEN